MRKTISSLKKFLNSQSNLELFFNATFTFVAIIFAFLILVMMIQAIISDLRITVAICIPLSLGGGLTLLVKYILNRRDDI